MSTPTSVATISGFKKTISKEIKTIANLIGKGNETRFISACVNVYQATPRLASCTPASLMNAFLEMARLQLYPSNSLGEAFVIPYKGKASFQIGYKGFVTLFWRAGCQRVDSQIVYENDEFDEERGLSPRLIHRPAPFATRGKPVKAYAVVKVNGETLFRVMSKEEIMRIAELSQSYKYDPKGSPWSGQNDPELWMWQKTVLKQLAKLLPKNEQLARAIEIDNISERGGFFADDGEVVEAPFVPSEDEKIEKGLDRKNNLKKKILQNA